MLTSSRASRTIATLAIVASSATVGVSAAGADNGYPPAFEKSFKSSCVKGAAGGNITKKQAKAYCNAVLKCIEKKSSYSKIAGGNTKVITSCSKKNAHKLTD